MADKPIIFSAPMVRALLEGRKTMTRRLAKRQDLVEGGDGIAWLPGTFQPWMPPYAPGDRLYVREACRGGERYEDAVDGVIYAADSTFREIENSRAAADQWVDLYNYRGRRGSTVPPIHVPRWASRLTLHVTAVKVERLQDISREDAVAEGLQLASNHIEEFFRWPEPLHDRLWLSPVAAFKWCWTSLHGPDAWAANPWVVAPTFTVEHRNIDKESA